MNRFERVRRVLMWDQVAAAAKAKAAAEREQLQADARAEYEREGTAPTWRIPDVGTVFLPISKESVVVADEEAFTRWVVEQFPDEVEPKVRRSFLAKVLAESRGDVDLQTGSSFVVWMREGMLVPGLAVRAGGQPRSLTFKPSPLAEDLAAAGAQALVDDVERKIGEPIVLAEPGDGQA